MSLRIGSEDFVKSHLAAAGSEDRNDTWMVCDEYVLFGDKLSAAHSHEDQKRWKSYSPLVDTPDLFLQFARVYEQQDQYGAALDFSHKFGLPDGKESAESSDESGFRPVQFEVGRFLYEAKCAWVVLSLYEAAINENSARAAFILSKHRDMDDVRPFFNIVEAGANSEWSTRGRSPELLAALMCSARLTQDRFENLCSQKPRFMVNFREPSLPPLQLDFMWTFRSLIGAMYLQMLWLMKSNGQFTRCLKCNRIVPLSRSERNSRKPRSDRKYCSDACKSAYHRSK